jgi:predicted AAA+ superfamily ATPase
MELLSYFHSHTPKNSYFVPRKTYLPEKGDVNLYGPRGCGKSALILDYIKAYTEPTLYIDLEDPNLILTALETLSLDDYIKEEKIHTLILDHYEPDMLESYPLVSRLIVISRVPLHEGRFIPLDMKPLDYEEFLAFEHNSTATSTFNRFLRVGTLPNVAKPGQDSILEHKAFFQRQFTANEQSLLLILSQHNGQLLTTHQIYTYAKEHFRISKDFVYSTIKRFEEEGIIHFIENAVAKGAKKMVLYDFAFTKYLTSQQPFISQFDTMLALSLIKHNIPFKSMGIHGYITQNHTLIIPAPFDSEEGFWVKAQNKFNLYHKRNVQKVIVVTVTNAYSFSVGDIDFEALPFYEWTVVNDEE